MNGAALHDIEQWMNHYYQHPTPEFTPLAIAGLSNAGKLAASNTREVIQFFLSLIFHFNPDKIVEWTSPFMDHLPLRDKQVLINALWLSDTREAKNYLNSLKASGGEIEDYILNLTSKPLPVIEKLPIDRPGILDVLWAGFLATGEKKYLIRIIAALDNCDSTDGPTKQLVSTSAEWILRSNIVSHPKVKLICEEQIVNQTPLVTKTLKNILEKETGTERQELL